jgi:adenylosuccinate lyase
VVRLAKRRKTTPTLGRTLLQPATPLALGQKNKRRRCKE